MSFPIQILRNFNLGLFFQSGFMGMLTNVSANVDTTKVSPHHFFSGIILLCASVNQNLMFLELER